MSLYLCSNVPYPNNLNQIKMNKIIIVLGILNLLTCSIINAQSTDFDYKKVERISDSIKIQNITIHNLFKSQILAHKNNEFDSIMIV